MDLTFGTMCWTNVINLCLKCRYEDKRWIPRNVSSRPSSGARDEKSSESQTSVNRGGHNQRSSFEQHRTSPAAVSKIAPVVSRTPTQVILLDYDKLFLGVDYQLSLLILAFGSSIFRCKQLEGSTLFS